MGKIAVNTILKQGKMIVIGKTHTQVSFPQRMGLREKAVRVELTYHEQNGGGSRQCV